MNSNAKCSSSDFCEQIMSKYQNRTWGIIQLVIAVFQSIICLFCFVFTMYIYSMSRKNIRSNEHTLMSVIVPSCTFLGIAAFLFTSICQSIDFWQWNTNTPSTARFITFFCWSFGQFCCYLVFFFRLIAAFRYSAYKIPRITIIYLVTLLILYEIAWSIYCVFGYCFWSGIGSYALVLLHIEFSMTIPIVILEILITISMIYMFLSRLFLVMKMQIETSHDHYRRMDVLDESLKSNGQNRHLLDLSIKIAALSMNSLLSSLLFIVLGVITYFYGVDFPVSVLLCLLWWQIDTVINCICLVLFLKRANVFYDFLCCGCITLFSRCMTYRLSNSVQMTSSESNGAAAALLQSDC